MNRFTDHDSEAGPEAGPADTDDNTKASGTVPMPPLAQNTVHATPSRQAPATAAGRPRGGLYARHAGDALRLGLLAALVARRLPGAPIAKEPDRAPPAQARLSRCPPLPRYLMTRWHPGGGVRPLSIQALQEDGRVPEADSRRCTCRRLRWCFSADLEGGPGHPSTPCSPPSAGGSSATATANIPIPMRLLVTASNELPARTAGWRRSTIACWCGSGWTGCRRNRTSRPCWRAMANPTRT